MRRSIVALGGNITRSTSDQCPISDSTTLTLASTVCDASLHRRQFDSLAASLAPAPAASKAWFTPDGPRCGLGLREPDLHFDRQAGVAIYEGVPRSQKLPELHDG